MAFLWHMYATQPHLVHYLHKRIGAVFRREIVCSIRCACPQLNWDAHWCHNLYNMMPATQLAPKAFLVAQAEGLELMQLILKEKRVARLGSLKVLDFATTRCAPACERWVDLTGLKQLFAIFMGKSKVLLAAVKLSQFCGVFAAVHLPSGAVSCMQSCSLHVTLQFTLCSMVLVG